jgi:carbon storage regulator
LLILTRHLRERIIIGDDIEVAGVGIRGGSIRLGIKASSDISVHRHEIYERIQKEKMEQGEGRGDQE